MNTSSRPDPNGRPEALEGEGRGSHTSVAETDWFSLWQLTFSLLGIFVLWGATLALIGFGLASRFGATATLDVGGEILPFLAAAGTALGGALLLPSAGYSFFRILGRPRDALLQPPQRVRLTWVLFVLFPLVLALGDWSAGSPSLAWIVLPFMHILAVGIPVFLLYRLGQRGLPSDSPQRSWGVFGSGLVLGPALSLVGEFLALVGLGILGILVVSNQPELSAEISRLVERLSNAPTPDIANRILKPYLAHPTVLYTVLGFGALIVPIIEELVKPIGVWLLVGSDLSPTRGFVAGILSGAGYALFENLALTLSAGEGWAAVVFARVGTSLIHILTASLMGWALALAWREGRYLRLGMSYLIAVTIHAMWNGLVLVSVITEAVGEASELPIRLSGLGSAAPFGLLFLTVGAFIVFVAMNAALRRFHNSSSHSQNTPLGTESGPGGL